MFGAKLTGPRQFELIHRPAPDFESAEPGSILVKTHRATICGSDMPYYLGVHGPSQYMAQECFPAHECVGEVVATHSDQFAVGDAVMSQPDAFAGLGQYYMARDWRSVKIPNDGDWNKWVVAQPLGTVIWGMRKVGALFHQRVVVLGQGAIGLLATQMAANLGASTIIAVDPHPYRLDVAAATGATHTLTHTDESLYRAVNEIVQGQGADLVVEAVGHQKETLNTAIRLVKHSGTILAFGVPDENVYPILYSELFRKNAHLITTVTATDMPKDFALAVQLIKAGRINVTPFVTHEFPFSRLKEAFDLFHERRDGVIKVMINYDQAE